MGFSVTVKVGIGGFSMGAAVAQYSATCFAMGRYGNGIPYPVNLRAVVGLSGWLPGSMYDFTDIKSCVYMLTMESHANGWKLLFM